MPVTVIEELERAYGVAAVTEGLERYERFLSGADRPRIGNAGAYLRTIIANKVTRNEQRLTVRHSVTVGKWRCRVANLQDTVKFGNGVVFTAYNKMYVEGISGFRTLTTAERTYNDETVLVVTASTRGGTATQNLERFNCSATRILPTQAVGQPPGTLTPATPNRKWITAAIHTLVDPRACAYDRDQIDWQSLVDVQTSLEGYGDYPEDEFNATVDRKMSADEQFRSLLARRALWRS